MADRGREAACGFCGGPFIRTVANKRFCRDQCRQDFHAHESPSVRLTPTRRARMLDAMLEAARAPDTV